MKACGTGLRAGAPRAQTMARPLPTATGEPPAGFRIQRKIPVGRHRLLSVFPRADRLAIGAKVEPDATKRTDLFERTEVEVVSADLWMYVAPHELPSIARRGWTPVVAPDSDCIVVGRTHLATSPAMVLYMDIFHELCHVRQRRDGANLWEPGVSYVRRWTELEAYRIVVEEARVRGASEKFLRDYLEVEWITRAEYRELLRALGIGEH